MSNALLAQLVINEYSPLKGTFDAFGNESDWVEIHNYSESVIDLSDFFLSDNEEDLANGHFLPFFHRSNMLFIALTLTRYFMTLASAPTTLILRYRWENPCTYLPPTKP